MNDPRTGKDLSGLIPLPGAFETRMDRLTDYITPADIFFICSAGETPGVDRKQWRLNIEGNGIDNPISLDYEDLKKLPQKSVSAFIECAGNHRILFDRVQGQPLNKRPHMTEILWGLGGVGMAEWKGVALKHVLDLAKIKADAYHVCPEGYDRGIEEAEGIRCPMPIEKALDPDTIVAIEMNGKPLLPDHGFPARMIVPGWVGTYSIKWLNRICVTTTHQWVHRNTQLYVMYGDDWPAEKFTPANGRALAEQSLKSSLALNWPAKLKLGKNRIIGYARSPNAKIKSVHWSADLGESWQVAELISPNIKYAWVMFAFEFSAQSGEHILMTRATDEHGTTQPKTVPFNSGGYLFNAIHPHPLLVE